MSRSDLIALAIAAALSGGAAFAGGLAESAAPSAGPVAPAAPVADWSGGYAGLSFGAGTATDSAADHDLSVLGAHGGYRVDTGPLVYGGELQYARQDIDTAASEQTSLRLKGAVGYDAGRLLPYVVVGLSSLAYEDDSGSGTLYGLGADFAVSDRVTVGAEYLMETSEDLFAGQEVEASDVSLRASFNF